jgi:ABC-type branched-subunit amino acid transport system substrate-binding protein
MEKKRLLALLGIISLVVILAALPFMTACKTTAPEVKELKVGNTANLTGFAADCLKLADFGIMLAADMINEQGGITINGEQYLIDLITEDIGGTPDGATSAATKLVHSDGVKFIVGTYPPHFATPITTVTEPAQVVYARVGACGTKAELGPHTPYEFLGHVAYPDYQESALTYLKEIHPEVKSFTYILVDDGQVPDNNVAVKEISERLGLTMLGDIIGWDPATVDWTAYVQKAIARNPDAIMTGNGSTESSGMCLKIAYELGFDGVVFACNQNPLPDILSIAGKEAAKDYFGHDISADIPEQNPLLEEVIDRLVAEYGRVDLMMTCGYNAMYCLAQAIEAAQSVDPTVVRDTWENMDTIDTLYGPGQMGGMETYGIRHTVYHRVPIMRLVNGELVFGKWESIYRP